MGGSGRPPSPPSLGDAPAQPGRPSVPRSVPAGSGRPAALRIIAWNIRAGGGRRAGAIAGQLARWAPDVAVLSEFRATPPSRALAAALAAAGLAHQLTTADPRRPARNALLVAARWPLRRVRLRRAPAMRARWLVAALGASPRLIVGTMHVPNRVTGRKYPFLDAVLGCARRWRLGPALLVGDTNSGRRGLDEEVPVFSAREEGWIDALAACGWRDAFRHLHAGARAYTWYSPNGRNGFRIDQAFVNRALLPRLVRARHVWAGPPRRGRRDALSDHAALLVDLAARPAR
jgi:exonuclease III